MSTDTRIHVTLSHLRSLQGPARGLNFLPRASSASALNGRHASRLRGRGLNFEEMRDYLPGDDIRSIDWKATARTGTPYVRVFTEERDRPALLVVDQRMSMFFGTRLNLKSVTAAEAAAVTAYQILEAGDRVGGIVFDDERHVELAPRRSPKTVHALLQSISDFNNNLHADREVEATPGGLNDVLRSVARLAHHDHLVVIFSDFAGIDETTHRHLTGIAAHNDLVLMLVTDPSAESLSGTEQVVIGDSQMQAEVNLGASGTRDALTAFSRARLDRIHQWQNEINLSVLPLSAGEETVSQIRQHMGRLSPRRRIR
ncbi:MAG: hypothetical protein ACI8TX_002237 [Hyphomicrobiaceae bacterium]|jgi:uncharacterized protein (DUF58 family)